MWNIKGVNYVALNMRKCEILYSKMGSEGLQG